MPETCWVSRGVLLDFGLLIFFPWSYIEVHWTINTYVHMANNIIQDCFWFHLISCLPNMWHGAISDDMPMTRLLIFPPKLVSFWFLNMYVENCVDCAAKSKECCWKVSRKRWREDEKMHTPSSPFVLMPFKLSS